MKSEYPDTENISLSEHYRKLFSDYHARSSKPKLIMQWSSKVVSGSPREVVIFRCFAISAALVFLAYITFLWGLKENPGFIFGATLLLGTVSGSAIAAREIKVIYRYRIFKTHARLAYCLNIPKHTDALFKIFAILGIGCMFMIGIMSGSILILAGPGGIAVFAALKLLNIKIPKKREWSIPWDQYNFVTVDRKRRFVITHTTDPTLGFEARLPNDELLEQYLGFLRSVLPASAQFTEKKWNLSLI